MAAPLTFEPGTGQDVQSFAKLYKFWDALWERCIVIGNDVNWPPHHPQWASGTVAAVEQLAGTNSYKITCTTTDSWAATVDGVTMARWTDYEPPEDLPGITTAYDIVLEPANKRRPWEQVRGPIDHQYPPTEGGEYPEGAIPTVTVDGTSSGASGWGIAIQHAIAGKFITGLSALVGRRFYIIKRGGLWSGDRMPELPNAHEAWRGNANPGGSVVYPTGSGTTLSYVEDADPDKADWAVDQFAGLELLVHDASNALRRVTIAANDRNRLYWTHDSSWTAGGRYCVVQPGARAMPKAHRWRPAQWYSGANDAYYTHMPDDNTLRTGALLAPTKITWLENQGTGGEIDCQPVQHPANGPAIDVDLIINPGDYGAKCDSGKTDNYPQPHLYKSWRMLQKACTDIGPNFVKTPPTGSQAAKFFYPAEWFKSIGLPNGTSSIYRDTDGQASFNVSNAEAEKAGGVHFVVYDADGTAEEYGFGTLSGGKVRPPNLWTPETGPTDAGKSVVWSTSYRRYWERRVRYLYPRAAFQPDVLTDDIGAKTVADPPHPTQVLDEDGVWTGDWSGEGCGQWIRRPASTNYAEIDEYGAIADTGPAFVVGDLVRVVGDNHADPTILERVPATVASSSTAKLMLPYYDLFFRGTYAGDLERTFHVNRSGTATDGGVNRLSDAEKAWWSDGVNIGTLVTHSYTPSAATATTVTLAIDVANSTSDEAPWFGSVRFVGMPSGKPFVDFVVEFDRVEGGVTVTRRAVITDCSTAGGHVLLSFAAIGGFTPATTDTVRIREPKYMLNKFEGRTLTLTDPAGATYTAKITHNDDQTLWFGSIRNASNAVVSSLTIVAGWTYAIGYVAPGPVLRWDGSQFVPPTGSDSARLGVASPNDFLLNLTGNLPTYVKGYGLHRRGDRIMDNVMLTELYRGINLLMDTGKEVAWTSRKNPAVREWNGKGASGYGGAYDTGGWMYDYFLSSFPAAWADFWTAMNKPAFPYPYPEPEYFEAIENGMNPFDGTWNETAAIAEVDNQAPRFSLYGGQLSYQWYDYLGRQSKSAYFFNAVVNTGVQANYAYPKLSNHSTQIAGTATVYAYSAINETNNDESFYQFVGRTGSGGAGGDTVQYTDRRFSNSGYPFSFREWTEVSSFGLDASGTTIGQDKVGGGDGSIAPNMVLQNPIEPCWERLTFMTTKPVIPWHPASRLKTIKSL